MQNTKVISAFPGTGKTTAYSELNDPYNSFFVIDSDSSKFPKDNFPKNYLEHIYYSVNVERPNLLFISSHEEVRTGLINLKIQFTLVYPNKNLIGEYIQRYIDRGSSFLFIDTLYKNWYSWIESCQNQIGCEKIELLQGQYVTDFIYQMKPAYHK